MPEPELAKSEDWYINGSGLGLHLPSGLVIRPTAAEVTGSEYKHRQTIRGENVLRRPSEALPQIRFARFPPEVIIELTAPASNLSQPVRCRIRLGGARFGDAVVSLSGDQILVGHDWLPLATDILQEIGGLLKAAGIEAAGVLSLKQYLGLRRQNWPFVVVTPPSPAANLSVSDTAVLAAAMPADLQAKLYPYQRAGSRSRSPLLEPSVRSDTLVRRL